MNELRQGTPLQGGRYIIKRVLGQGGFGITYLAEQVSLGRNVAIKEFFMKDNCQRNSVTGKVTTGNTLQIGRYHAKFLKEARTLSGLSHPNIISIIDVFEENGTAYYAMPFMPNGSLSDLVKRNGPLQEDVALRYIKQIAQALKYMHNKHLCHFDVKPANILLDANDNAVLIDFGISKNYDAHGNETSTTPIGMSEGYAPLEQYQQMVSEFSPASDVYSLGGTLYYLVMGKVPPSAINIAQGTDLELDVNLSYDTRNLIEMAMRTSSKQRLQNVDRFIKEEQNESSSMVQDVEWEDDEEDENTLKLLLRKYREELKWWMTFGIIGFLGILCYALWQGQQPYSSDENTILSADSTMIDYCDSLSIGNDSNTAFGYQDNMRGIDDQSLGLHEQVVAEEQDNQSSDTKEIIFRSVDEMPQFPGGDQALMKYLSSHINYPPMAAENNVQGKVILQFVVGTDGRVGEVKIARSVDKDLDKEAVRVVKSLPKFIPGRQNGQAVPVWYTLPVSFKLQGTN